MATTTIDADKIDELQQRGDASELFEGAHYEIPVPKLDGHRPDTIKLAFAGGVEIDIMINQDLEFLKGLKLGQEIDLEVTATVAKVNWAHRVADPETGEEKVTHTVGLNVNSFQVDENDDA